VALLISVTSADFETKVIQDATLNLSEKGVPTIRKVLPLYKVVQSHLETSPAAISPADDTCNLRNAIKAGLANLQIHIDKALISDYPLIGAGTNFPRQIIII
jgi:hypothetical protein